MENEKNMDSIITDSVGKVVLKNVIPAVLALLIAFVEMIAYFCVISNILC